MQKTCSKKVACERPCVGIRKIYQDENYANVKVSRTNETSLKLKIAETFLPDLEEFQKKSEQVLVRR